MGILISLCPQITDIISTPHLRTIKLPKLSALPAKLKRGSIWYGEEQLSDGFQMPTKIYDNGTSCFYPLDQLFTINMGCLTRLKTTKSTEYYGTGHEWTIKYALWQIIQVPKGLWPLNQGQW